MTRTCIAIIILVVIASPSMAQSNVDSPASSSQIAILRDDLNKLKYKVQCTRDSLNEFQQQTSDSTLDGLRATAGELARQASELDKCIIAIRDSIRLQGSIVDKQEKAIQGYKNDPRIRTQRAYIENKDLLQKPFSQMHRSQIESLQHTLRRFRSQDDYANYEQHVILIVRLKQTYDNGVKVINSAYDYKQVDDAYRKVNSILEETGRETSLMVYTQKVEMDSLRTALIRYYYGVMDIQNLIKQINADSDFEQARNLGNATTCQEARMQVIDLYRENDEKDMLPKYLRSVPYLRKLWQQYLDADPLTTSDAEKELLSYKYE